MTIYSTMDILISLRIFPEKVLTIAIYAILILDAIESTTHILIIKINEIVTQCKAPYQLSHQQITKL